MTDAELVHAWAAGDRRAGEALFEAHFAAVLRFFRNKMRRDDPQIDDLVQRTFLGVLEGHERLREAGSFRAYLFGIARNQLFKQYRSQSRSRELLDFSFTSVAELQPSPSSVLAMNEAHRQLLLALQRLPVELQLVVELQFWEQLTVVELAEVVQLPVGTAKTRLRRARQLLAHELSGFTARQTPHSAGSEALQNWLGYLRAADQE